MESSAAAGSCGSTAAKPADRDFVAAYIDSDPSGNGRRLGEVALVDTTSRIGQSGRTYFHTLLDENAAAHIAFGSGFGGTRTEKPARGLNRSGVHLDVMIGGPDFEAVGDHREGEARARDRRRALGDLILGGASHRLGAGFGFAERTPAEPAILLSGERLEARMARPVAAFAVPAREKSASA